MIIELFKQCYGKSTRKLKLYDHVAGATEIALYMLDRFGKTYPKEKRDTLIFSTFAHDLGKLNSDFQAMLQAVIKGDPLPSKRVKHEASTLEYIDVLRDGQDEIIKELFSAFSYKITDPIDLDMVLAFAVSHHGLFYMSYESTKNYGDKWLIRREWTTRTINEVKRITLVDLLLLFHPFGGLVMVSDLIHSFCHEKGIDYRNLISETASYGQLLDKLIEEADNLEMALNKDDPRSNRGIKELLELLMGGVD
ncbi:MAG: hypothetical protein PWR06_1955 [Thermoanaerobacteraceae bacterium]|nr:hypothetical protein [Thermoanaerobacteraceae bacterium]